ncbi:Sulfite reductase [NADPH] hemoprotein beta-component [Eubacterium plexicaudatum ASF492]|nr:Sulfite reductase [NADPH] hemoprotein beta-component [Eubacterium plexicaudatum ASF492]
MLRLRMPAGRVTKERMAFTCKMLKEHNISRMHFTTCQTIQLHDLQPESVCRIMEEAIDAGIIVIGGGGDYPRNVMCPPLSGVEENEYFDVMPCAEAAGDYLLRLIPEKKMPRKLKVGFSNSPMNLTHVTYRDLGFAATKEGTFDVYSAGDLALIRGLALKLQMELSRK